MKLKDLQGLPKHAESLPTRERELKLRRDDVREALVKSLPTRERELKRDLLTTIRKEGLSLPTRERELKRTW